MCKRLVHVLFKLQTALSDIRSHLVHVRVIQATFGSLRNMLDTLLAFPGRCPTLRRFHIILSKSKLVEIVKTVRKLIII